jgi:hypothetical protein
VAPAEQPAAAGTAVGPATAGTTSAEAATTAPVVGSEQVV